MVKVDVGPYIEEVHHCAQKKDCSNPRKSDFANAPVVTGITNTFAESNPEIAELMSKVSFTNKQLNEVLAWQEKNTATAEEAAVHFITHNKDIWSDWLNDAAKQKLAPLLK